MKALFLVAAVMATLIAFVGFALSSIPLLLLPFPILLIVVWLARSEGEAG